MNKKKVFSMGIAAVCAAAIAISGTFAWYSGSSAINEFEGTFTPTPTDPGVLLHDDFAKNGTNKDVYVENTGDTDLYVRIKLSEFYARYTDNTKTDTIAVLPTNGLKGDVSTWELHDYIAGDSTPADCDNGFHADWTWKMGDSSGSFLYNKLLPNAETATPEEKAAADDAMGPKSYVIPASAYDVDNPPTNTWIVSEDGYAYWSDALKPDTVTGKLLDSVTPIARLANENYYYAINVAMEAVTPDDVAAWLNGTAPTSGTTSTLNKANEDMADFLGAIIGGSGSGGSGSGSGSGSGGGEGGGQAVAAGVKTINGLYYKITDKTGVAGDKAMYEQVNADGTSLATRKYVFDRVGSMALAAADGQNYEIEASDISGVIYYPDDVEITFPLTGEPYFTITEHYFTEISANIYLPLIEGADYVWARAIGGGFNCAIGGGDDVSVTVDYPTRNTWLTNGFTGEGA